MNNIFLTAMFLISFSVNQFALDSLRIKPGTTVRVKASSFVHNNTVHNFKKQFVGALLEFDRTSMLFHTAKQDDSIRISYSAVERFEIAVGPKKANDGSKCFVWDLTWNADW